MVTLDDTERRHVQPGMDVYDVEARKLGSVLHIYEGATAAESGGTQDLIEVRTGFLGLGKHLFIPYSAIRDVTEGGVFLTVSREEIHQRSWDRRPADIDSRQPAQASAPPSPTEVSSQTAVPTSWEEAAPLYRARWQQRYGEGAQWEHYEARYRFAWDMAQVPELAGQPWPAVHDELRRRWEVLHPETEWETVREAIQDAWERLPMASGTR